MMARWYQSKEKGETLELAGLGFSERKSPLSLAACGPAGSKFTGNIVFFKNFVLSCPTRKDWALRPAGQPAA
jgi:hypothetical protein